MIFDRQYAYPHYPGILFRMHGNLVWLKIYALEYYHGVYQYEYPVVDDSSQSFPQTPSYNEQHPYPCSLYEPQYDVQRHKDDHSTIDHLLYNHNLARVQQQYMQYQ